MPRAIGHTRRRRGRDQRFDGGNVATQRGRHGRCTRHARCRSSRHSRCRRHGRRRRLHERQVELRVVERGSGALSRGSLLHRLSLAHAAQVPKIFINYKAVNQATTQIPLTLVVSFFPWPLIGLISILALALVVLIAGGWFLTRETPFPVSIDGESRMIGLRPLQSKEVRGMRGTYIVSRGLFGTPNTKLKSA